MFVSVLAPAVMPAVMPAAVLSLVLASGAVGASLGAQPAPTAGVVLDTTYRRLHWATVMDSQLSTPPVEASRLLTPADWTFDGHVKWGSGKNCLQNLPMVTARATSPDGLSALEIFSPLAWQWFDDSATRQFWVRDVATQGSASPLCPVLELVSPADYIRRAILPRLRPGAREIAAAPMPHLAAAAQAQMQTDNAALLESHRYASVHADAARLEFVYEIDGHPVEEWITATVEVVGYALPALSPRKIGDKTQAYFATAMNVIAYRAPAGTVDSETTIFATMVNSIRVSPTWVTARNRALTAMLRPQISTPGDRGRMMRAEASHSDLTPAEKPRLESPPTHQFDEFVLAAHGLTSFTDPVTHGRIDLDSACPRALSNGTGDYLLSPNPTFDPAAVPGGPWTPLRPLAQ